MKEKVMMFKGLLESGAWMAVYMILQTVLMIYFIFANLADTNFQMKFYEEFLWMLHQESMSNMDFSLAFIKSMLSFSDDIMMPSLISSGLIMLGLWFISEKQREKKENRKMVYRNMHGYKISQYVVLASLLNLVITIVLQILPDSLMESYMNGTVSYIGETDIWFAVLGMGVLAPIAEEISFRYFMINTLKKREVCLGFDEDSRFIKRLPEQLQNILSYFNDEIFMAVLISSLAFGIVHGNLVQGIYCFILGMIFAVANEHEKSLLPGIVMHITINTSSVIIGSVLPSEYEIIGLAVVFVMACAVASLNRDNYNFVVDNDLDDEGFYSDNYEYVTW